MMSSLSALPKITGFFSYARADDKNSRGGLSKLHKRIQSELCILLGRSEADLQLWKDTGGSRTDRCGSSESRKRWPDRSFSYRL
jgi:hypothetical protein